MRIGSDTCVTSLGYQCCTPRGLQDCPFVGQDGSCCGLVAGGTEGAAWSSATFSRLGPTQLLNRSDSFIGRELAPAVRDGIFMAWSEMLPSALIL